MKVSIHLFASFRVGRFDQQQREYCDGTTLQEVIDDIGVDIGIESKNEIGMVLVNGRHAALNQVMKEGDRLSLFPLVGGG